MKLGIIGGSGLYDIPDLKEITRETLETPFGSPSDSYVCGILGDCELVFLPRHGRNHTILPSEINHRANIFGFKVLGVETIVSVTAVGSLREDMRPRDVLLPDQYFDRTKQSAEHTFFGNGVVAHVAFADPTCDVLRNFLHETIRSEFASKPEYQDLRVNNGGVYVNMEGPAFSTKAESHTYRKLGFDVIGMTSLAEAKLSREAELCYAAMSLITDYDCWHESEAPVTLEMVLQNLAHNTELARGVIRRAAAKLPDLAACSCRTALKNAIVTSREIMPLEVRTALQPIIGKYFK